MDCIVCIVSMGYTHLRRVSTGLYTIHSYYGLYKCLQFTVSKESLELDFLSMLSPDSVNIRPDKVDLLFTVLKYHSAAGGEGNKI